MKLKKTIPAILLATFISVPANAEPMSKTDWAFQGVAATTIILDWRQTRNAIDNPKDFYEKNPMLSEHPSKDRVDAYFLGSLIGNTIITRLLPNPYRRIWQIVTIGVEINFVVHNTAIGAKVNF